MSGLKNVVFSNQLGKPLEVDVCAVPSWDGFDKLVQFLKNEYAVEIIDCVDGPDVRRCRFRADGQEFDLRHEDPYGNSLVASTFASENIVRKIGLDLENRFNRLSSAS